jgi:hypothetical protein
MTDFNKLVEGLSSEDISSLMFSLCRSGKVVIPQFFTSENIETITGDTPSIELIVQIQKDFECDDNFIDMVNEKIHNIINDGLEDFIN